MGKVVSLRGFTIVELMVAVAIVSVLGVSVVSFATEQFRIYAIANTRTLLAADVQQQLQTISDDIRSSNAVAQYNGIPDDNAPQSLVFPGTTGPNNQKQYWRSTAGQLVIERVPVTVADEPIYDNPTTQVGKKDYIVYYVRDNSLFRRVIPADYPNNKATITNCAAVLSAGGCNTDRLVTANLRGGVNGFNVTYLAKNGSSVPTADPSLVQSISVKIDVENKRVGRFVRVTDSVQTAFRFAKTGTDTLQIPASVVAGPGGLVLSQDSSILGRNVAIQGKLTVETGARIGTYENPVYVSVANKSCGAGNNYGKEVCTDPPISMYWYSKIYGDICATGQTQTTWGNASLGPGAPGTLYTRGLINTTPACTPSDVEVPKFPKASYTGYAAQKPGAEASCSGLNGVKPTSTWNGNTVYQGDVTLSQNCVATMEGNVYITGNLRIDYNAKLLVKNTGRQPVIVVNGGIEMFWGGIIETEGGEPPYFISFKSRDTACSASPTCTDITDGNLRKDSVNDDAIKMTYGSVVSGSLFNAYYGTLRIFWTDGIQAGALAGQRIVADQNQNIVLLQ